MRKLYVVFLLAVVAQSACETDQVLFKGPYFVRFTETAIAYKESYSKPVFIEVHNGGLAQDQDMVIGYTISGNAREGVDYLIVGDPRTVIIKKGSFKSTIQIKLINNANNIIRSQDLIITLSSVNIPGYQIGQDVSGIGKSFTFTIIDDCILGGTYIGQHGVRKQSGLTLTSNDCSNYVLSNWNIDIDVIDSPYAMDLKFVDNGDNTITIPKQKEENLKPELATIKGSGVVDPVSRMIILTIVLLDYEDQPQVMLTLQPD